MGMILRIASSRIVGQGDIVGRSGYFSLNLSANSVMRGRLDARRTLKSLVADLRYKLDYRFIQCRFIHVCTLCLIPVSFRQKGFSTPVPAVHEMPDKLPGLWLSHVRNALVYLSASTASFL